MLATAKLLCCVKPSAPLPRVLAVNACLLVAAESILLTALTGKPLLGSLVFDLLSRLVLELVCPFEDERLGIPDEVEGPLTCCYCDCLLTISLLFSLSSITMCICLL